MARSLRRRSNSHRGQMACSSDDVVGNTNRSSVVK